MENEDILKRLMETEKSSRELVSAAQAEVDRRLSEARRKAEEDARAAIESAVKALEAEYAEAKRVCQEEYRATIDAYSASLDDRPSNVKDFNALLSKICDMES
jgi:vacuolar-type H+-ATPase subunit H